MSENREQIELLREMVNWLRLLGMKQFNETIESILTNDIERSAYQYSDGQRTTREIEDITGMNRDAVSKFWKKCFSSGLGEYKTASGGNRFKRTFDLKMFGMQIPEINKQAKEEKSVVIQQTGEEQHG